MGPFGPNRSGRVDNMDHRKSMPIEQVQRLLVHVKIDKTMHQAMVNQANVMLLHRKYIG